MGIDYSYECVGVKIKEIAHTFEDGTCLAICNLKFNDEHGHPLKKVKNVLVYIGENLVKLPDSAEDCLPEDATEELFDRIENLCKNHPGYDFYDEEESRKLFPTKIEIS